MHLSSSHLSFRKSRSPIFPDKVSRTTRAYRAPLCLSPEIAPDAADRWHLPSAWRQDHSSSRKDGYVLHLRSRGPAMARRRGAARSGIRASPHCDFDPCCCHARIDRRFELFFAAICDTCAMRPTLSTGGTSSGTRACSLRRSSQKRPFSALTIRFSAFRAGHMHAAAPCRNDLSCISLLHPPNPDATRPPTLTGSPGTNSRCRSSDTA